MKVAVERDGAGGGEAKILRAEDQFVDRDHSGTDTIFHLRLFEMKLPQLVYLEQLSKLGTHGTCVPDVAKTLIEDGIRQAIKEGFLKQRAPAEPTSQG